MSDAVWEHFEGVDEELHAPTFKEGRRDGKEDAFKAIARLMNEINERGVVGVEVSSTPNQLQLIVKFPS